MTKSILVRSIPILPLLLALSCASAKNSDKFAPTAAQGGIAEVEMGRLAIEHAADSAVKEFGQRMVTDHSRAGAELTSIAARKQIQLPAEVSSSQKSMMEKLSKLSGAEFDKEYMSEMVKDHEADAKEFQTQANEGTDPDIKAFAVKTLPIIQEHLQMARDVAKKVGAK
jgi:putative membrane protein